MRSAMQFARFSVVLSLVTLIVTFADFRWLTLGWLVLLAGLVAAGMPAGPVARRRKELREMVRRGR